MRNVGWEVGIFKVGHANLGDFAGKLRDLPEDTLRGLLGKPQDLGPHHPEINP